MENNKLPLILTVDDTEENLEVLINILSENAYDIAVAMSGFEALEILNSRKPELILLDIMMPEMDGYEVCTKIKTIDELKDIPIIFLTAKTEMSDILKGFQLGAVDYITKPFNKEELLARVGTHITLVRALENLVESEIKLTEANNAKDRLFSIISHDLRSHVGTLMSTLEILVDNKLDTQGMDLLEFINGMRTDAEKTFYLLENLLNWSKNEIGALSFCPQNENLFDVIIENIELFDRKSKEKNILISTDCPQELQAFFDHFMISTVIRNLISNAIKFTKSGDEIDVLVNELENSIEINVQDSGVGISEENIKKLFGKDKSFTLRGTSGEKGTGLGLILCKDFVEKNGGKIRVESELNKGTKFIFNLPKAQ